MNFHRIRLARAGVSFVTALACFAMASSRAWGQVYSDPAQGANPPGISVSGKGEVRAKPNFVEIDMRSAASAELTADALVKYRDSKRRTLEAFDKLQLKELAIEERGLTLSPGNAQEAMQMAWRGMGGGAAYKMQVEISSTLHLKLGGIRDLPSEEVMETIGKLLDTAQDSGAGVGPSQADINNAWRYGNMLNSSIVRFVVRDLNDLREEAYTKAVADARKRAERLARLNGVRLGGVLSVNETYVSGDDPAQGQMRYYGGYYAPAPAQLDEPHLVSESFSEVNFQVRLMVRFAIAGPAEETAKEPTAAANENKPAAEDDAAKAAAAEANVGAAPAAEGDAAKP